jgi:magnesium-transporting ATPase (P-type)
LQNQYGGAEQIAKKLGSDSERGICDNAEQLAHRAQVFGNNKTAPVKIRSLSELIWECFDDFILQILIVAAIFQLAAGLYEDPSHGWMEGTAILIAIVIIVAVTSSQNYAKEK